MKTKRCRYCGNVKPLNKFNSNGWCNDCMKEYLKMYKSKRLDFSETILSEEDMQEEMNSIKVIDPKGLNALIDLSRQVDKAHSIKSFHNNEKHKSTNSNSKKAILYNQINFNN
jgi:hypothetical protein